ncbi:MAG: LysR family transcriptional regulator [Nitriliruptorales bacterium]|nr:LysR family transcriptional regulator [Nitriliruptorales bacterium]
MRRPSIHQLDVFCRVVRLESMVRAAEEFHIAPSSISMQIQDLERKFRAPLLIRGRCRIVPTVAGQALYTRALSVLATLDAFERDLAELAALEAGVLRFASSRTIGWHLVPPVLRLFERTYPKVDIEYHVMASSQQAKSEVLAERAEFALVGRVDDDWVLDVVPLVEERLLVVVSPRHPLATVDQLTTEHLGTHALLLRESPVLGRDRIMASLRQVGISPEVIELGSTEAIKAGVLAGRGVGMLPQTSVEDELAAAALVARAVLGFAPCRTVYLAKVSKTPLSSAADSFVSLLRDRYAAPEDREAEFERS